MIFHIRHFAVKTLAEPVLQASSVSTGVREGNADITKAEFPGPGLDMFRQMFEVLIDRFGHGVPVEWQPVFPAARRVMKFNLIKL